MLGLSVMMLVGLGPSSTYVLRYRPVLGAVYEYRVHLQYKIPDNKAIEPGPKDPKVFEQRAELRFEMRQTIVAVDRTSFTSRLTFSKPKFDSAGIFDEAREGMATFKFETMTLRTDFRGRQLGPRLENPLPFGGDFPFPIGPVSIGDAWTTPGSPGSYAFWGTGQWMGQPALEVSCDVGLPAEKGTGVYADSRMWIDARDGFMLANSAKVFVRTSGEASLVISLEATRQNLTRSPKRKS